MEQPFPPFEHCLSNEPSHERIGYTSAMISAMMMMMKKMLVAKMMMMEKVLVAKMMMKMMTAAADLISMMSRMRAGGKSK